MPLTTKRHKSLDMAAASLPVEDDCSPPQLRRWVSEAGGLSAKKRVSFDTVDLCEHAVTLGDEVVSEGAPVTIEWHAQSYSILSVDEFERSRPSSRTSRIARRLSAEERFCLLSMSGIPMRTSLEAAAEATQARILRQESVDEVIKERMEEQQAAVATQMQTSKAKPTSKKMLFRKPKALWSNFRSR